MTRVTLSTRYNKEHYKELYKLETTCAVCIHRDFTDNCEDVICKKGIKNPERCRTSFERDK